MTCFKRIQCYFICTCSIVMVVAGQGCSKPVASYEGAQLAWDDIGKEKLATALFEGLGDIVASSTGNGSVKAAGHTTSTLVEKAHKDFETASDKAMQSNLPVEAFNELVASVSQKLAVDLPNQPEVKESEYQMVLAIGEFGVKDPRQDKSLEVALQSVKSKILKNEAIKNSFVVLTSKTDEAQKIIENINGKTSDAFLPTTVTAEVDTTKPVQYHPKTIYRIAGEAYQTKDEVEHTISVRLFVTFSHVLDRREIHRYELTRDYIWHPKLKKWFSRDTAETKPGNTAE